VHDVVGLFVDTRLTPVPVRGRRTIADLVHSISAAWRAARRHEVAHVDGILDAIGRPELVKVDLSASSAPSGGLRLAGSEVTPVPVPWNTRYWRNLTVSWESGERAAVKITFRPSVVHREVPGEVVAAMMAVVARSVGRGQPTSGK
ncbi:MAG TPA: hypothetical protein VNO31_53805, partial [Umezawaea sp.]|nr:hypothetical protein [Umezawaea sp.]